MAGTLHSRRLFAGSRETMIILEIGGNHEGDFAYAKKLVALACASKAQVIKLQIYSADGLVNPRFDPGRHAHFKKFELEEGQYRELLRSIKAAGKTTCASVWSESLYRALSDDIDILKVGSGDFDNFLLTDLFLRSGKPVILSSGLAAIDEVSNVMAHCKRVLGERWPSDLALLQCTTSYPCPPEHTHINVVRTYREMFNCAIGFSDHFEGTLASEVAFDVGAQVLEFHFTDSRENKAFRDHKVSWTRPEVDAFAARADLVDRLLGGSDKILTDYERDQGYRREFRKGLYFSRSLTKGHVITADDLVSLRPAAKVDPSRYGAVVGQRLTRDAEHLDEVLPGDFGAST